ncbi:MAG: TIR domain-containing protein [bacterium]|nr:TIR domain-containing protein [bacterium]
MLETRMRDAFISYSRRDQIFAFRLLAALEGQQIEGRTFDVWLDKHDIPYSADWWKSIQDGIRASQAVIFIVSPESLSSPVCQDEIEFAFSLNKQIIPVIRHEVDEQVMAGFWYDKPWEQKARDNWARLERINWMFMRRKPDCKCQFADGKILNPACDAPECDVESFDHFITELLDTLRADLPYRAMHTRLLERAEEWTSKKRNTSFLLRGVDLTEAENWQASAATKTPAPTQLHAEYILASRRAANRFQRILLSGVTVAFVVALVLSGVAFRSSAAERAARSTAVIARQTAERSAAEAQSLALASLANTLYNQNDDPFTGLALALQANQIERPSPLAQSILADIAYTSGARQLYSGQDAPILSLAVSPDEHLAASGGNNGTLFLWEIGTGEIVRRFEGENGLAHQDEVFAVAFSPDGTRLLSGGRDGFVRLWNVETGELLHTFEGHTSGVTSVAFSPDGLLALSGSFDRTAILWDVGFQAQLGTLTQHGGAVLGVAFSPDNTQALTASSDGLVRLWDVGTGELLTTMEGHEARVNSVAFSPDGARALSGADDSTAILWDISALSSFNEDKGSPNILATLQGHSSGISSVAFSADGRSALTASADGYLSVWNMDTLRQTRRLRGHRGAVRAGVLLNGQNGRQALSASQDGFLILWDIASGAEAQRYIGQAEFANEVAFTADGAWMATGADDDGLITVYDLEGDSAPITITTTQGEPVNALIFSTDGAYLFAGYGSGRITRWSMREETPNRGAFTLDTHTSSINSLAINADNSRLLSASSDQTVILWDLTTTPEPSELYQVTLPDRVWSVGFHPDGSRFVTGSADGLVGVWQTSDGNLVNELRGHFNLEGIEEGVTNVSYSHDGRWILSSSLEDTLILWDAAAGSILKRFRGHNGGVTAALLSPDGRWAVSSAIDGFVILWDVASAQPIRRYEAYRDGADGDSSRVTSVTFRPNGNEPPQFAAATYADGGTILWRLDDLPALETWVRENRFTTTLRCDRLTEYGLGGLCDALFLPESTPDSTPPP